MNRIRPALLLALLVVPACGSDDEPRPAPSPAGTTVVAALGDSITAGSPRWDPNPDIRAQIGSQLDRRSQYELWAERALADTDFRNCGVPGQLTDEIERRLEDCADGADILIIQGGVNDIGTGRKPTGAGWCARGSGSACGWRSSNCSPGTAATPSPTR